MILAMVTWMSLGLVQTHRKALSAGPISCWQCGYIRSNMSQTSPPVILYNNVAVGWGFHTHSLLAWHRQVPSRVGQTWVQTESKLSPSSYLLCQKEIGKRLLLTSCCVFRARGRGKSTQWDIKIKSFSTLSKRKEKMFWHQI